VAIILLLAIVGGAVDAVIVLSLGVLVAAQTGNTIFLAVALSERQLTTALHSLVSLVSFVAGVAIGEGITVRGSSGAVLTRVGWALLVELMALGTLVLLWSVGAQSFKLVAIAAAAMGIQSAAALRLNVGPATTYVTGSLTTFTIDVIRPVTAAPPLSVFSGKRPLIYGVTWVIYFAGALAAGMIEVASPMHALLLPVVALTLAVIVTFAGRQA
jgi:uncharacterized membrane protein YoaK (UPF0700 family)